MASAASLAEPYLKRCGCWITTGLEEVKQLLDSLEKELEHTIPATANTQVSDPPLL